eukprot:2420880-Rhodomonas_salina.1
MLQFQQGRKKRIVFFDALKYPSSHLLALSFALPPRAPDGFSRFLFLSAAQQRANGGGGGATIDANALAAHVGSINPALLAQLQAQAQAQQQPGAQQASLANYAALASVASQAQAQALSAQAQQQAAQQQQQAQKQQSPAAPASGSTEIEFWNEDEHQRFVQLLAQ